MLLPYYSLARIVSLLLRGEKPNRPFSAPALPVPVIDRDARLEPGQAF